MALTPILATPQPQATDLLGTVFGLSPTFTVDTQRRRRLFGPSHAFYD
jgi:hypothetical protein